MVNGEWELKDAVYRASDGGLKVLGTPSKSGRLLGPGELPGVLRALASSRFNKDVGLYIVNKLKMLVAGYRMVDMGW